MLAVMFDQELYAIFNEGKVIMPGTGVAPFIHKVIMGLEKPETPWNTFVTPGTPWKAHGTPWKFPGIL